MHRDVQRTGDGYLKKAAGPYNPSTKYASPEKIAQQNKYMRLHNNDKLKGFIAAENIAKAEAYFDKWYGVDALQWLQQFRFRKNDELEVLATVDMAVQDLRASGMTPTPSAVKMLIRNHPEWKAKLDRPAFSDENILTAMVESEK